jgi:ABC-2 type transport system permease protein
VLAVKWLRAAQWQKICNMASRSPSPYGKVEFLLVLAVPALLLFGFDLVYEPERVEPVGGAARYTGLTLMNLFLPTTLGIAIGLVGLVRLPQSLNALASADGEPRTTKVLSGVSALVGLGVVSAVFAVVVAWGFAGVARPTSAWTVVAGFAAGVVAVFGVGALIAAVTSTPAAAAMLGRVVFWPMVFISGAFAYVPLMSDTMQQVSSFTPLGAAVQMMQNGWFGAGPDGSPTSTQCAVVMLAWAVVCWPIASWRLRTRARTGGGAAPTADITT